MIARHTAFKDRIAPVFISTTLPVHLKESVPSSVQLTVNGTRKFVSKMSKAMYCFVTGHD